MDLDLDLGKSPGGDLDVVVFEKSETCDCELVSCFQKGEIINMKRINVESRIQGEEVSFSCKDRTRNRNEGVRWGIF